MEELQMTDNDRRTALLLLLWSRTMGEHRMTWEAWLVHKAAEMRTA